MDDIAIPFNETLQEDIVTPTYTGLDVLMGMIIFPVVLVDLLIIFIIAINKRLQTRTYWIFLNWTINSLLFLILDLFRGTLRCWLSSCSLIHIDYLLPINCTLLMLMMISNELIDGKRSLAIILACTYLSTFLLLTGFTLLCVCTHSLVPGFLTLMLISLIMFGVVMVKEFNKCRKNKSTPVPAKTAFRMNLGRICIYNFMTAVTLFVFFDKAIENKIVALACMVSFMLTPVYEFIYIIVADKNFRIATSNVFKSVSNWRRLDAEFNLTDDE